MWIGPNPGTIRYYTFCWILTPSHGIWRYQDDTFHSTQSKQFSLIVHILSLHPAVFLSTLVYRSWARHNIWVEIYHCTASYAKVLISELNEVRRGTPSSITHSFLQLNWQFSFFSDLFHFYLETHLVPAPIFGIMHRWKIFLLKRVRMAILTSC